MFLNKLLLKDFGKFHNKEIELNPGLNLICGPHEAGKTTIKDFIVGMFYGIDKSRGAGFDNYELRKPLEHSGYSGKAYLKDGEDTYLIERSFLKNNRKVSVMNIKTGQDVRLGAKNSMQGVMLDVDKNTYASLLCIGEDDGKTEIELANLSMTGAVNIDKTAAIEGLLNRKKSFNTKPYEAKLSDIDEKLEKLAPLDAKLEGVREGIREVDQEFAIETARRKREARKLIETDKGVEYEDDEDIEEGFEALRRNSTFLDADLHEGEKPPKPLTERLWFILLTGLFVIGVISALVYILPFEAAVRQLFIVCTVLFVAVTIVEGLYAKGAFEGDVVTPTEDDFKQVIYELERKTEAYQDVEIDMSFANEYMDKKAELRTLENAILEKIQAREGLKEERLTCAAKLKKLQDEVDAIDLAIKTITDVSAEIHDDLGFLINDKISDIVSEITDGRYGDVKLDEEFRIKVWDGSSYVSVKHLNAGAVEQVYLAIRLGVARVLCRNKMPLIIDDIFTNYDEKRFANILNCLKTIDTEQIILMTSNNHIRDMLDGLDIHYNYIELD